MILVLAGNEREFNEFLKNHEPKNIFRFISNDSDYTVQELGSRLYFVQ